MKTFQTEIVELKDRVSFLEKIVEKAGLLDLWQDIPRAAKLLDTNDQALRKLIRSETLKFNIHWKYKLGSTRYYLVNVAAVREYFIQKSVDKSV